MKFERFGMGSMGKVGLVAVALAIATSAWAENRSAKVISIKGDARYQVSGGTWQPLKNGDVVPPGSIVQTAQGSQIDLLLDGTVEPTLSSGAGGGGMSLGSGRLYNPPPSPPSETGSVVRLQENTILGIDKLTTEKTGNDTVKDTQLDLKKGKLFGTTQRVSGASKYEIKLPNGVAAIRGTIYAVGADGTVWTLSGTVFVTVVKPDGATTTMQVPAGSAYNPISGQMVPLSVPQTGNLEQVVADMGYTVYTSPTETAIDNTTVWVSPTMK